MKDLTDFEHARFCTGSRTLIVRPHEKEYGEWMAGFVDNVKDIRTIPVRYLAGQGWVRTGIIGVYHRDVSESFYPRPIAKKAKEAGEKWWTENWPELFFKSSMCYIAVLNPY